MQVEAKMQLCDAAAYAAILEALAGHRVQGPEAATALQESRFFDTADGALAAVNAVCRVRLTQQGAEEPHASVSLKEHGEVDDGSTARFVFKDLVAFDVAAAATDQRGISAVLAAAPSVASALQSKFGAAGSAALALEPVGGFVNHRDTFMWAACQSQPGLLLRVDKTVYPFGERYEVEVPGISVPVQDVLDELGQTLAGLGIQHLPGDASKFAQLHAGLQAQRAQAHMSVQAKVLLGGAADYAKVREALAGQLVHEDMEHNHFFDGPCRELFTAGAIFRVRATEHPPRVSAVVKEHGAVADGSSLCWAQEHELGPAVAERLLAGDASLLFAERETEAIAVALRDKFGVSSLAAVGSFDNRRTTFAWPQEIQQGLRLRLDATQYPFGERYEIEVPDVVVPIHDVLDELGRLLARLGVAYTLGHTSKFEHFWQGTHGAASPSPGASP